MPKVPDEHDSPKHRHFDPRLAFMENRVFRIGAANVKPSFNHQDSDLQITLVFVLFSYIKNHLLQLLIEFVRRF
jgi:hypothetical protein